MWPPLADLMNDMSLGGDTADDGSNDADTSLTSFEERFLAKVRAHSQEMPKSVEDITANEEASYVVFLLRGVDSQNRHEADGEREELDLAISYFYGATLLSRVAEDYRAIPHFFLACCHHTRYLHSNVIDDIDVAIRHFQQSLPLLPPQSPFYPTSLTILPHCLYTRYRLQGHDEDLEEAIQHHMNALLHSPQEYLEKSGTRDDLSLCLVLQYRKQNKVRNLEAVIEGLRSLALFPTSGRPDLAPKLYSLSVFLRLRYGWLGDVRDLDEAIQCLRDTLPLYPSEQPEYSQSLNDLGRCLRLKYKSGDDIRDLEQAIHYGREALQYCPPDDQHHSEYLQDLANSLITRFNLQNEIQDLDVAIECFEQILLDPSEHMDRREVVNTLAVCLVSRYHKQSNVRDLEGATQYYRDVLVLSSPGQSERIDTLGELCDCLAAQIEVREDIQHLEEIIRYLKELLLLRPAEDSARPKSLSNLCGFLRKLDKLQGGTQNLEEAIQYLKEELPLCPSNEQDRSYLLTTLAGNLLSLYEQQHNIQNLNEAMQYNKEALALHPLGHPDRLSSLRTLADSLITHYTGHGGSMDLDEAIQCFRDALLLCPPGHPERPALLNNLAGTLQARHAHQGIIEDLIEAMHCCKEALYGLQPDARWDWERSSVAEHHRLKARPVSKPNSRQISYCKVKQGGSEKASFLNSLSSCLHGLYCYFGTTEHLKEATQCLRDALLCYPTGHPNQAPFLNSLAHCIQSQYEEERNIQHLEEAIQYYKDCQQLYSPEDPGRVVPLNNLINCLQIRYPEKGETEDLEEAVRLIREVIRLYPPDHPDLATAWTKLASFCAVYNHLLSPSTKMELEDITSLFKLAVNHKGAYLKYRLAAAVSWAQCDWGKSQLDAYQTSLQLADQYLLIQSSISSRHQVLVEVPHSLASDAAAAAIDAADLERAVEFLEQGRTLLWSQMNRYRISLYSLREVDIDLAEEFERLSRLLDSSATPNFPDEVSRQTMEDENRKYRRVSDAWRAVVEDIRKLDGFSTFLQPLAFVNLKQAARNGPVIIVNISDRRSDAIIVSNEGSSHLVPLPGVQTNYLQYFSLLFKEPFRSGIPRKTILGILRSLWDDIVEPVVTRLQDIGVMHGSRIWWCPTSHLVTLPLHAAGPHRRGRPNLPDLYISSYTPALSALIRSQINISNADVATTSQLLVIAQSDTPGQPAIPSVQAELRKIKETVPSVDLLQGENGTQDAVLASLQTHPWVHFTCHGSQHAQDPFESCFHLRDKPLTLLDIIQARLPNAQYAFLSACHSAAGDSNRPDETIHLAAALQFSGFRSVIGTMYAMADIDGPALAEEVYKYMCRRVGKEGSVSNEIVMDHRDTAEALNVATKVLIKKGVHNFRIPCRVLRLLGVSW